jgi:AraC-like DNA-binding protein
LVLWGETDKIGCIMNRSDLAGIEATWAIRFYSGERMKHEHDYAQIMFALEGRMELEIGGRSAFADSSCGIVIPAGVSHGFEAVRGARMLVIDASSHESISQMRRFAVTPACRQLTGFGNVAQQLTAILHTPKILVRRGIDIAILDRAIDRSLHESWSTARMAALFFLSPQRFHHRLLELTGVTPQTYLRRRRLELAMRLLARGMPLETAALQVGYRSPSALTFALRRDFGVAARKLRRVA